ncbi:hypothetical protein M2428_000631 [Arthrobacter sp. ES3-54]|nr:hypothetical protein [Arthrobacter sp. ES3-54]
MEERANQFLETSFLPGRPFTSPADFNVQLAQWLSKANARLVPRTNVVWLMLKTANLAGQGHTAMERRHQETGQYRGSYQKILR